MARKRRFGVFRSLFDFRPWMGASNISRNARGITDSFSDLKKARDSTRAETYEEAIARMKLTEADVLKRKRQCLRSAWIYFSLALVLFLYGIYLLFQLVLTGVFMAWILSAVATVMMYRESFWYMQMKKKKLGCTFKEWTQFILRRSN